MYLSYLYSKNQPQTIAHILNIKNRKEIKSIIPAQIFSLSCNTIIAMTEIIILIINVQKNQSVGPYTGIVSRISIFFSPFSFIIPKFLFYVKYLIYNFTNSAALPPYFLYLYYIYINTYLYIFILLYQFLTSKPPIFGILMSETTNF